MKLSTSLVSVKRISSKTPRSKFSNEELEKSAQAIVEAEGIISPLILQQTGINIYEVIAGDFEYHAAARAREIDPRKAEMVEAYILNEENEKAILEQVGLLRKSKTISSDAKIEGSTESSYSDRIDNLEARSESRFKEIRQEIKQGQKEQQKYIEEKFAEFADKMPKSINALETFNKASATELAKRLVNAGFSQGKAKTFVDNAMKEREKNGEFKSLNDVVDRVRVPHGKRTQRGVSGERMLDIVDSWSETYFNK